MIALQECRRASVAHVRAGHRAREAGHVRRPVQINPAAVSALALPAKRTFADPRQSDQERMGEGSGRQGDGEAQTKAAVSVLDNDLAALAKSRLMIGTTPLSEIKPANARPMWVRFEEDGVIQNRMYRTTSLWRVRVTFALKEGRSIRALEMDEWGRLKEMFPKEVCARLAWNAAHDGDVKPVARLFDPNSDAEMLLIRSRCQGHAVDVLHNLTEGGPVFQPLWISDIMRLHPLLGIKLVRDEAFNSAAPISILLDDNNPAS